MDSEVCKNTGRTKAAPEKIRIQPRSQVQFPQVFIFYILPFHHSLSPRDRFAQLLPILRKSKSSEELLKHLGFVIKEESDKSSISFPEDGDVEKLKETLAILNKVQATIDAQEEEALTAADCGGDGSARGSCGGGGGGSGGKKKMSSYDPHMGSMAYSFGPGNGHSASPSCVCVRIDFLPACLVCAGLIAPLSVKIYLRFH